jgi:hypothetical protein
LKTRWSLHLRNNSSPEIEQFGLHIHCAVLK